MKQAGSQKIILNVNKKSYTLNVQPNELLLDVLRDRLGLTGTKKGCETGECGGCTVLLEKKAVNSCLVLAVDCRDKEITTIEGLLTDDGKLNPIQQAFVEQGAIQCGYCSPGMIMSIKALLYETPEPSEEEIKTAISGNLCRCGTHPKIVKAVQSVCSKNEGD